MGSIGNILTSMCDIVNITNRKLSGYLGSITSGACKNLPKELYGLVKYRATNNSDRAISQLEPGCHN